MLDKPRIRAFAEFVRRYGVDELERCLLRNKGKGIVYHYEGGNEGDYDKCQTEEEIIHMIKTGFRFGVRVAVNRIKLQDYIENPCRASSLPYWKTKSISVPDDMLIVHDEQYQTGHFDEYNDERYFRLRHDMNELQKPELPHGYDIVFATTSEYVVHINACYSDLSVTDDIIRSYVDLAVYDANLWVAVADAEAKQIVASGIAEYDPEVSEGTLEWIQVTEAHREKGLGQFIVKELLWRMREKAAFVTVSGKLNNKTNPERLYRRCGFTGSDVWHILRRKV